MATLEALFYKNFPVTVHRNYQREFGTNEPRKKKCDDIFSLYNEYTKFNKRGSLTNLIPFQEIKVQPSIPYPNNVLFYQQTK